MKNPFSKLFNRNNKNSAPADPAPNQWEQMARAAEAERDPVTGETEAEKTARLKRQGDKLVAAYLQGPEAFSRSEVAVTDDMRDRFAFAVSVGEHGGGLSDADKSRLLQNIALPSQTPQGPDFQRVFDTVNDKHGRTIMSYVLHVPDSALNADSLGALLNGRPTPFEFAAESRDFLNALQAAGNPPQKVQEYATDIEKFQHKIYGKRYEYYQALEELQQQGYNRANPYRRDLEDRRAAEKRASDQAEYQQQIATQNSASFQARAAQKLEGSAPYSSPETKAAYEGKNRPQPDPEQTN